MSPPTASTSKPVLSGYSILPRHRMGPIYLRSQIGTGSSCVVFRARTSVDAPKVLAVKVVMMEGVEKGSNEEKKVFKECKIHEVLKHRFVLELVGAEARERGQNMPKGLYIAMNLASGGDLFDKIPPDIGLTHEVAQLYFCQLHAGLVYIHSLGISHRDLKPENLLLSPTGQLQITDFGLAAVYKHKGQSRLLNERCGSAPYAAPELGGAGGYEGEPVDCWGMGVILFAMLVGNTPWDEPTVNSPEFEAYTTGEIWEYDPWTRIKGSVKQLLKGLLTVNPKKRLNLKKIEMHDWVCQPNPYMDPQTCEVVDSPAVAGALTRRMQEHGVIGAPSTEYEEICDIMESTNLNEQFSATQAVFQRNGLDPDTGFQSSLALYSRLSMAKSQRGNPHLDRFFSVLPLERLVKIISAALTSITVLPSSASLTSTTSAPFSSQLTSTQVSHALPEGQGIAHQILRDSNASNQFLVRFKIGIKDRRGQDLQGSIMVSEGGLEPERAGQEGVKGLDVWGSKKVGDTMEWKRVWMGLERALPGGVVYCT